jgi:hypothetical protein
MVASLEDGHAIVDILASGIALDIVKQPAFEACGAAMLQHAADQWQCRETRVGNQQRPAHAQAFTPLRQFADAACANLDGGRVIPVHGRK